MSSAELGLQALVSVVAIVCYTVLEALGHDVPLLLGVVLGQAAAIGAGKAARKVAP